MKLCKMSRSVEEKKSTNSNHRNNNNNSSDELHFLSDKSKAKLLRIAKETVDFMLLSQFKKNSKKWFEEDGEAKKAFFHLRELKIQHIPSLVKDFLGDYPNLSADQQRAVTKYLYQRTDDQSAACRLGICDRSYYQPIFKNFGNSTGGRGRSPQRSTKPLTERYARPPADGPPHRAFQQTQSAAHDKLGQAVIYYPSQTVFGVQQPLAVVAVQASYVPQHSNPRGHIRYPDNPYNNSRPHRGSHFSGAHVRGRSFRYESYPPRYQWQYRAQNDWSCTGEIPADNLVNSCQDNDAQCSVLVTTSTVAHQNKEKSSGYESNDSDDVVEIREPIDEKKYVSCIAVRRTFLQLCLSN